MTFGSHMSRAEVERIRKLLQDTLLRMCLPSTGDISTDALTLYWSYQQARAVTWKSCMRHMGSELRQQFS